MIDVLIIWMKFSKQFNTIVYVTATGLEPRPAKFVTEHSAIWQNSLSLADWLSGRLRTKCFWVVSSKEFLDIQSAIECGFTRKWHDKNIQSQQFTGKRHFPETKISGNKRIKNSSIELTLPGNRFLLKYQLRDGGDIVFPLRAFL